MHLINVFAFFSKVANPMVRANAAALLTDTFPLQNPDAANEEIDALLQKQFDIMKVPVYLSWSENVSVHCDQFEAGIHETNVQIHCSLA